MVFGSPTTDSGIYTSKTKIFTFTEVAEIQRLSAEDTQS